MMELTDADVDRIVERVIEVLVQRRLVTQSQAMGTSALCGYVYSPQDGKMVYRHIAQRAGAPCQCGTVRNEP